MTSDPLTLGPNDPIAEAEEIMNERGIRQLPVVRHKELVGIITDRDIRSFLGNRLFGSPDDRERAMNTKVASVMSSKPSFLAPEDDVTDAIELLIEQKIGGIPVVDGELGLVGIVTYVDLLRHFLDHLLEEE